MMTRALRLTAVCVAGLAMVGSARAATLPVPTVEYSADRTMETEGGTFTGKIYSAKGKERSETSMGGMQSITILRHDKRMGWMLIPAQHMYQQMDFGKAREQSGAAPDDVQIDTVGAETIEGRATTKYKLIMKDGSAGGFIWISQEGIPVKMDMLSKSGKQKTRVTITLTNIQIGAQDEALFEVPSGYNAMPSFGGLGSMFGKFGKRE